jgi:hypothetical protein
LYVLISLLLLFFPSRRSQSHHVGLVRPFPLVREAYRP